MRVEWARGVGATQRRDGDRCPHLTRDCLPLGLKPIASVAFSVEGLSTQRQSVAQGELRMVSGVCTVPACPDGHRLTRVLAWPPGSTRPHSGPEDRWNLSHGWACLIDSPSTLTDTACGVHRTLDPDPMMAGQVWGRRTSVLFVLVWRFHYFLFPQTALFNICAYFSTYALMLRKQTVVPAQGPPAENWGHRALAWRRH